MKTQDTYRSILKGVSQQPPNERLEGQHGEQVNLISDPVHGLVRRNGLISRAVQSIVANVTNPDAAISDSYSFRVFSFSVKGDLYDLLYRSRPTTLTPAHLPGLIGYDKQGAQRFMDVRRYSLDTGVDAFMAGGFSSMVVIGSMILLAGNTVTPTVNITPAWATNANLDKATVYIKTGAYARTYKVKAKSRSTGLVTEVSYTTPTAAYTGTLVVDDLDPSDSNYQAYLNNRIYAYENAQNQWAVSAAQAIVPTAIALELHTRLLAAGAVGWGVQANYLHSADIEYVEVGQDATGDKLIQAVHNELQSEQELSPRHYTGKVVKITPTKGSDQAYYMQATASSEFGEVTWREVAGVRQEIVSMIAMATVHKGELYFGSSPEMLKQAVMEHTTDTIEVPLYAASQTGDLETMPAPVFATRPINLLAVFQDRLIVGSGNVLRASAIGDYLNFYQKSVLTVAADGASADLYAAGTNGDTIRKAALYDRNLTLYGDSYHYVLPGRSAFDPANPQLAVQYAIEGAGRSQPVSAGDKVFIMKEDTALAAVQVLQMTPGVWQDSPAVDTISKQLRSYLNGTPAEMVSVTSPNMLFVRTEFINRSEGAYPMGRPFGLYTYNYMDTSEGRAHEAWSAWEWSSALGTPIGIGINQGGDGVLIYTMTFNTTADGLKRFILALDGTARSEPSGLPWIDGIHAPATALGGLATKLADTRVTDALRTVRDASFSVVPPTASDAQRWAMRPFAGFSIGDNAPQTVDKHRWAGAYGDATDWQVVHPAVPAEGLWSGFAFDSFVDLTTPVMRNHEDKARLYGRLVITKLRINTIRTGGIVGYTADGGGIKRGLFYDGGYIRDSKEHTLFVGRDSKNVSMRLQSVDWNPMNISSLAWQGDWMNSQRTR